MLLLIPFIAPVNILKFESPQNITEGYKFILTCQAVGRPKPSIDWFKDNTRLTSDDHFLISNSIVTYSEGFIVNSTVEINAITQADGGVYNCTASNAADGEKKPLLIDVQSSIVTVLSEFILKKNGLILAISIYSII